MNVSVPLTPGLVELIEAQVASGRYASASEVVREALFLLESVDQRDAKELQRLRNGWEEGAASGDAGPLDFAALKAEALTGRGARPGCVTMGR